MLAVLREIPKSEADWSRWAFHNRQTCDDIRQAIQDQGGANLTEYILFPFETANPGVFLTNNAQFHIEMTSALGQQSHDLEFLNFKDPGEVEAWINTNYQELFDACTALGIS